MLECSTLRIVLAKTLCVKFLACNKEWLYGRGRWDEISLPSRCSLGLRHSLCPIVTGRAGFRIVATLIRPAVKLGSIHANPGACTMPLSSLATSYAGIFCTQTPPNCAARIIAVGFTAIAHWSHLGSSMADSTATHCTSICWKDRASGMDGVLSGLTLAAVGLKITNKTKRCCNDYRDAPKHILQAQQQRQQIELNQALITQLPQYQKEQIGPSHSSLQDLLASLSSNLKPESRKDRVKWILGQKSKIEEQIKQCTQIESSISLGLLMTLCQDL